MRLLLYVFMFATHITKWCDLHAAFVLTFQKSNSRETDDVSVILRMALVKQIQEKAVCVPYVIKTKY